MAYDGPGEISLGRVQTEAEKTNSSPDRPPWLPPGPQRIAGPGVEVCPDNSRRIGTHPALHVECRRGPGTGLGKTLLVGGNSAVVVSVPGGRPAGRSAVLPRSRHTVRLNLVDCGEAFGREEAQCGASCIRYSGLNDQGGRLHWCLGVNGPLLRRDALGHDEGDIVVLFVRAELPNLIHDRRQQVPRR